MRKVLLGTSALVAAGLAAGPANAADKFQLGVGGFIEEWFGYTDAEEDAGLREWTGLGIINDAEVHFKGSVVLDNGLKVAGRIELESNSDRQNVSVDEVWLQISSDALGMLELGEQDAVTDIIAKGRPEYGIGLGDIDKWIQDVPSHGTDVESATVSGNSDDFSTVNYYTPVDWQKLTGLQAAFTWKPDINNNDSEGHTNEISDSTNAWAAGLTFSRKIADVRTNLAYGYYTEGAGAGTGGTSGNTQGMHGHQAHANFVFGPWELGGGYARTIDKTQATNTDSVDGWAYNVGIGYTMGRWAFSLARLQFTNEDTVDDGGSANKYTKHMVSVRYDLGGGIDWRTSLFNSDLDAENTLTDADTVSSGWGLVTGIRTSF